MNQFFQVWPTSATQTHCVCRWNEGVFLFLGETHGWGHQHVWPFILRNWRIMLPKSLKRRGRPHNRGPLATHFSWTSRVVISLFGHVTKEGGKKVSLKKVCWEECFWSSKQKCQKQRATFHMLLPASITISYKLVRPESVTHGGGESGSLLMIFTN